jgi:hypothetical protein
MLNNNDNSNNETTSSNSIISNITTSTTSHSITKELIYANISTSNLSMPMYSTYDACMNRSKELE